MLVVSPTVPERLEVGKQAYFLKPPTVLERTRWRRAIAAAGGRQHSQIEMLDALAAGVSALMADDAEEARAPILQLIADHRAKLLALAEAFAAGEFTGPDADKDALQARLSVLAQSAMALSVVEAAVKTGVPAYAEMVADNAVYPQIAGLEAARLFLTGWEGFDADLVKSRAGVSEESLAQIPEFHLSGIASFIEALARVPESKRKNSASPPLSSSGGETSSTSKDAAPSVH